MKKYLPILTPAIAALLLLLRHFKILTGFFASPVFILLVTLLLSVMFAYMERNLHESEDQTHVHYENLDIIRFLFAIIVVIAHMRPFFGYNTQLDIFFNYILSRVCVPIFFIITGYFCAKKEKNNPHYIKIYIKKMIPVYLLWSTLYLPLGVQSLQELQIPITAATAPLAILVGLLYAGTYYHLWYFPALFIALIMVKFWKRYFSMRSLLCISIVLLCLGASETYYGFFPQPLQQFLSTYYFQIFYTTRNFLFFGLFYVALGYVIGLREHTFVPYSFLKMLFFCFLLVIEVLILQPINRLNSNILLSCVPLCYYMFITLLHHKPLFRYKPKIPFRDYYKFYYFLHPAIIFIMSSFFFTSNLLEDHYWIQIILVFVVLQAFTVLISKLKKKYPRALRYL